jgi:hypothetical protein
MKEKIPVHDLANHSPNKAAVFHCAALEQCTPLLVSFVG